jgi:uncharacterized protein (TIGR02147 family)
VIFEHSSYRSYLKQVLVSGPSGKGGELSLRELSRRVGVAPSQLSETLNGKVGISLQAAQRVAARLGLEAEEAEYFCLLVQLDSQPDPEARAHLLDRIRKLVPGRRPIRELSVDLFRTVSDWYPCAILELMNLKGFKLTPEAAAERLDISRLQAEVAIERLERLEIIARDESGEWKRASNDVRFQSPGKSTAMRNFYRQMLGKISEALESQEPFKERLSGFETIPLSARALPEANEVMEEFFEKMIRVARKHSDDKDRVYHLSVHFINLTPVQGAKS